MAPLCIWTDLPRSKAHDILAASDVTQIQTELRALLPSDGDRVILDMYYYLVVFCREQQFDAAKLSTLFSILKRTHARCVSVVTENFEETFAYFKELVLQHSVHRPGFSDDIFSLAESKLIISYFLNTFFRHYKLYKLVCAGPAVVDIQFSYPPAEI